MGKDREDVNSRSKKQELKRAAQIGGRRTAGSGSSYRSPGDVRGDDVLEELKFTDKKAFSLKVSDLLGILVKALNTGREPRMVVDFSEHNIRVVMTIERIDG